MVMLVVVDVNSVVSIFNKLILHVMGCPGSNAKVLIGQCCVVWCHNVSCAM